MKLKFCVPGLVVICAVFFCGCNDRMDGARESESESAGLQLFEKGKGLRLPEEMQRSLGVETVEVTDRTMARRIEKPAQVYRVASELQPAAAIVWLNAADVAHLSVGQTVSLKAPSAETFAGTLARLDQRLTNLLGQSEAVIEFPDAQRRAPMGSLLTAIFAGTTTNAVTAIPASAIIDGVENSFVYTVSGSHYVRTPVKPGTESDGWVEIVDGLYAGDVVVAGAVDALWTIELCALKGGTPCCPVSKKPGRGGD